MDLRCRDRRFRRVRRAAFGHRHGLPDIFDRSSRGAYPQPTRVASAYGGSCTLTSPLPPCIVPPYGAATRKHRHLTVNAREAVRY